MKKSMLYAGLMTILSTTVYAEDSGNPNSLQTNPSFANGVQLALQQETQRLAASETVPTPSMPGGINTPSSNSIQTPSEAGVQPPATGTPTQATGSTATPALDTPTTPGTGAATGTSTAPSTGAVPVTAAPTTDAQTPATSTPAPTTSNQVPATSTPAATAGSQAPATTTPAPAAGGQAPAAATITAPQPLNCNYRIPSDTSHIEQTIVTKWAEKAAEQSFDYDFNNIDKQIAELKTCYTEQGWQGFNDALQKSGNLAAIKTQQLTVSSMVSGESKVTEIKDNQWKITIPMHVVYQNNKEKLTQPLTVNLVVGRKVSGDLGIMQMIAVPSQPLTNAAGGNPQPTPEPKPQ